MTATLACPQGCGWTTTARTQPIAAYALRRHQGDPPARLTTAERHAAVTELWRQGLNVTDISKPKGKKGSAWADREESTWIDKL